MAQTVAGLGFAPQLPEAQRALAINSDVGGTSSALASPGPDTSLDTPSFGSNPLGALGYLLQSFSAGMQGQPLPGERLQQRRALAQQTAFQQIQMSLQVADALDKI